MKNPSLDNNAVSIFEGKEFQQVYKKDNYKVSIKNEDLKCYIYFSGSGIYYPNTIDEFEKAFIQQDRYEWYTYDDIQSVGKYIWVRDIAKQFYILGINEHVNTLEKLIEMLKKETEGYKTVCIGSSAGGYAAAVVGEYLKAEYILDFSGFFSLNIVDKTVWPLVLKYENDIEKNSYYNLRQCIIDNQVPIFYFYPT